MKKVLSAAVTGRSTFYNHYSGLGNLVATEWDNDNNAAEEVEEFRLDALGHQVWRRSADNNVLYRHPEYTTRYAPGTSRVTEVQFRFPPRSEWIDSTVFVVDTTFRNYDAAGSVQEGWERGWNNSQGSGAAGVQRAGRDVLYRRAPRLLQRVPLRRAGPPRAGAHPARRPVSDHADQHGGLHQRDRALCVAGDNILWELRGPGADTETADRLELQSAVGPEHCIVGRGVSVARGVTGPGSQRKTYEVPEQ